VTPPPGQRGAALLAVLLLVAVMAALSVLALEKLRLSTRLSANGAALDQARAFALGAEAVVASRITDLNAREHDRTSLAGNWQGQMQRIPIPLGYAGATVTDGGNCFNLNSVAQGLIPTALVARPAGIAQFATLMRLLGIDDRVAHHIAAALGDWVDGDSVPDPDGAEDETYAKATTPYRAANTLLAEPSELRAVSGVTPEIYAALRPYICALPTATPSVINVNTLTPDQAVLLAMLAPGLDRNSARAIIAGRPAQGWADSGAFWSQPALATANPVGDARGQVGVRTAWFNVRLDVMLGAMQVQEMALIDGSRAPAKLVWRRWGEGE
jgi:general secretion pathway protein K